MPAVTVRLNELEQLVATFERNGAAMDSRAALVVRKAAFDVERYAKQGAPVRTGFLKNSIHTVIVTDNWRVYRADIIAGASYASFVEHGTTRQAPHPYMQPAADRVAPGFTAALTAIANPLDPR